MNRKNHYGLTLVEVLIAIVVGSLGVAAIYFSYDIFSKNYKVLQTKIQVNRDLRFVISDITKELRNAGYHSTLNTINGYSQNPYPTMNYKLIIRKNTYYNMNSLPGVWYTYSNTVGSDALTIIYDLNKTTRVRVDYARSNDGFLKKRVSRCITADCYAPDSQADLNQIRYTEPGYYQFVNLGVNLVTAIKVSGFDQLGNLTTDITKTKLIKVSFVMESMAEVYKQNTSRTFKVEEWSNTWNDKKFRDIVTVLVSPRNL